MKSHSSYDALTPDELRTLDHEQRIGVLAWLYFELKRIGDLKDEALELEGIAKINALDNPGNASKKALLLAQKDVKKCSNFLQVRREQIRLLQTITRTP